jgi:hypothetical protein
VGPDGLRGVGGKLTRCVPSPSPGPRTQSTGSISERVPIRTPREDFERVNGFDLRFRGWGGEDEDIAARLRRLGLRCGWPGPRATTLHLWHRVQEPVSANRELLRAVLREHHVQAIAGLRELVEEPGDSSRRFERREAADA